MVHHAMAILLRLILRNRRRNNLKSVPCAMILRRRVKLRLWRKRWLMNGRGRLKLRNAILRICGECCLRLPVQCRPALGGGSGPDGSASWSAVGPFCGLRPWASVLACGSLCRCRSWLACPSRSALAPGRIAASGLRSGLLLAGASWRWPSWLVASISPGRNAAQRNEALDGMPAPLAAGVLVVPGAGCAALLPAGASGLPVGLLVDPGGPCFLKLNICGKTHKYLCKTMR